MFQTQKLYHMYGFACVKYGPQKSLSFGPNLPLFQHQSPTLALGNVHMYAMYCKQTIKMYTLFFLTAQLSTQTTEKKNTPLYLETHGLH